MSQRFKNSSSRFSWSGRLFLCCLIFFFLFPSYAFSSDNVPIKIGVLAKRGVVPTLERWRPTADYLSQALPGRKFEIVPLDFEEVHQAARVRSINFLITNSSYYVLLESDHGLSRIATMVNLLGDIPQNQFGGVILTRADRSDINRLSDLRGKSFWAVSPESLGGWLAGWREFNAQGIRPGHDLGLLKFSGTHDSVVMAVHSGIADAGTVRTDTLETMAAEGKISLADFKILNQQTDSSDFTYLLSTRLYPEWPFAALPHTDPDLVNDVTTALLQMPNSSNAARSAKIAGWNSPDDYQPIYDLLRERHLSLYQKFIGDISAISFAREHWPMAVPLIILLFLLTLSTAYTITLNRKLEQRVNERTRELVRETAERKGVEEKLHRAEKMEAIGLMASGVAHDLNNILSGIVNYPELMLMRLPEDSDLRRPISVIRDSGLRAADVVDDLLTLARGAAKVRICLDFNALVHEYLGSPEIKKVSALFPEVVITERLMPEGLQVNCAPTHVKKCIMNLVLNAAEAVGSVGEIIISSQTCDLTKQQGEALRLEDGQYVILSISDNGSGIAPEDQRHIFEPFYTKKNMGRSGTGIGLAVVWNCLQEHDGTVTVYSDDKGTDFSLYFPVFEQALVQENAGQQTVSDVDLQGDGESILIVDDEAHQREIATEILTELGYQAKAVDSGEEAVVYLKSQSVDLLLLDMIMAPGIDGLQTYQQIKKIHPDQKALIVSGYAEGSKIKEILSLGASSLLRKPYVINEIGLAVKKALSN